MTTRPILMSGPMVRALLAGRKTQTRRVAKTGLDNCIRYAKPRTVVHITDPLALERCPYGAVGDRLWVRETVWLRPERTERMMRRGADTWPAVEYHAGNENAAGDLREQGWKLTPSIHMPRWASRITLQITDVRVERVNDISESGAIAEGVEAVHPGEAKWQTTPSARDRFLHLFYDINRRAARTDNPWVWAITFTRVDQ